MKVIRSKYGVLAVVIAGAIPLAFWLTPSRASSDDDEIVITGGGWIPYCDAKAGVLQSLTANGSCEDGCEGNTVSWTGAEKRSDPGYEETCSGGSIESHARFDPDGMVPGDVETVSAAYCGKSDSVTFEVATPPCSVSMPGDTLCPGGSTTLTLTIVNLASCSVPYDWSITPTTGEALISISPMSNNETIAAGATKEIDISATVQSGSPMGTLKNLDVKVKVNDQLACSTTSGVGVFPASCNASFGRGTGLEDEDLPSFVSIQNNGTCPTKFIYRFQQTNGDATVSGPGGSMTIQDGDSGFEEIDISLANGGCPNEGTLTLDVEVNGVSECQDAGGIIGVYKCPDQTVTIDSVSCGDEYGGVARLSYACNAIPADGWFMREFVTEPAQTPCQVGQIWQNSDCTLIYSGYFFDGIVDTNGPPGMVAPCTHITNQLILLSPTELLCEEGTSCLYATTQKIEVTLTPGSNPPAGKVIFTATGATDECSWTTPPPP